ncbi:DsbA family oxidoreductase [Saccharospirillum alexandrii]|uniref:DsbA family oxidoreductase n=1 Tax=Saccharospirillum alexandrii TaxID=2448477 RepID=UPI000FDA4C11|nr:DsbA family oxidoreductase [Saccharospirillum alexandrii]
MKNLSIDVVSDVACPWCVIGYKNLEQALASLDGEIEADLAWHAFELRPDAPAEGENWREHIMAKYGMSFEQSEENRKRITEAGSQVGFTFNFTDDMRTQNTFNCHRLLHWAKDTEQQTALKLALFEAYFTDRTNVNDTEVLLQAVEKAGLDRDSAAAVLASDRYEQAVRAEEGHYQQMGVSSVPTFIVNGKYAITGGQPAEVFVQALRQIASENASTA